MLSFLFIQNANQAADSLKDVVETSQAAQNTVTELVNGFVAQLPLLVVGAVIILLFWCFAFIARKLISSAFATLP